MPNTIGTAYIQIEPTTEGISGKISSALDGEASKAGKSAGNALSGALGTAAKVGVGAIVGATGAVAAFGKASVETGAQFDSAMSQVAATMGFSTTELNTAGSEASKTFEQLSNFAQEMGSTTAFSATEAADALNYMALAGYDADTAMEMLPNVLNLAAAGGIGLASASDMVTDAQSALGLSLEKTTTMVDQMAKTASNSNTSVGQLGDALLTIGATGRQASGGTKELASILGVLADNGIKGAEGGTHLRNIMLSMQQHADKLKEALDIDVYDTNGSLRDMTQIFQELQVAMGDMTDAEKTEFLTSEMFNKTDLASVNALLATSSERWTELSGAIDNSKDAAQNMADVQLDNLAGDITLFQSALEGAKIAVSDQLTPSLREFVQFGSEGLSQLTESFKEGGLDGLMETLGTLLSDGLAMIVEKIPDVISAASSLISAFGQGLLDNLPLIAETALQVVLQLGTSIAQSANEIIPMVVDTLLTIVDTLIDNIDLVIDAALQLIVGLAEGLAVAAPKLIEKGPEIVMKIVEGLVRNLPKILEAALKVVVALGDGLIKEAPKLLLQAPILIAKIIEGIKNGIKDIQSAGEDVVAGLWNGIKSAWSSLKENVAALAKNLVGTIKSVLGIHSPSKVMADEVGKFLPEGIAVGVEANMQTVDDAMEEMGLSMNSSLANSFSELDSNNYGQVIAPQPNENNSLYNLLAEYLPIIAEGNSISIEGDADKFFRVMRDKNSVYKKSNGISAFA